MLHVFTSAHLQREPLNVVSIGFHHGDAREGASANLPGSFVFIYSFRQLMKACAALIARQGSYLMCACALIATPEMRMSDI